MWPQNRELIYSKKWGDKHDLGNDLGTGTATVDNVSNERIEGNVANNKLIKLEFDGYVNWIDNWGKEMKWTFG